MKIYIIPSGWDKELVLKSAFKSGADKVCLISAKLKKKHTYSKADLITQSVTKEIKKDLERFTKVEILETNYINLKETISNLIKYIDSYKDAEFIVNISTGSHLIAASLILVAHIKNLPIEYSIAKKHNQDLMKSIENGNDMHQGFSEVINLPTLPFSLDLSSKEKKFLKQVKDTKKLCVKKFIAGLKGNQENRARSEFNYLAHKLEKQGLVKIKKDKALEVILTPLGGILIESF